MSKFAHRSVGIADTRERFSPWYRALGLLSARQFPLVIDEGESEGLFWLLSRDVRQHAPAGSLRRHARQLLQRRSGDLIQGLGRRLELERRRRPGPRTQSVSLQQLVNETSNTQKSSHGIDQVYLQVNSLPARVSETGAAPAKRLLFRV